MTVIDIHTHCFCAEVEALVAGIYDPGKDPYWRYMSAESADTNRAHRSRYAERLSDTDLRCAEMQRMGTTLQIISPAPAHFHYWADEELQRKICRVQNNFVADTVARGRGRYAGLGTLPMRYPQIAADEAARAVGELGLRGFQIDSRVGALELSDPFFSPVWLRLEALAVPLFIHPLGFSEGRRLTPFFMANSVGQPLEEMLAAMHLIAGGVLDRHSGLEVVIAHGGGYLPYYVGRMDHAWKVRPEVRKLTAQPPSAYLKRLWFDTCIFRTEQLALLVELVGADRVMLGSDYPYDMGDDDPVVLVRRCDALDEQARAAILSGNARSLFGLAA